MFQRSRSTQVRRRTRVRHLIGRGILLLSFLGAVGCDFTELFSDDFLVGVGVDSIAPPAATGTVIVTLTNNTAFVADMFFFVEPDAQRVPEGEGKMRTISLINMPSGFTGNSVFDCPLDRITPGVGADLGETGGTGGTTSNVAAQVFGTNMTQDGTTETTTADVAYLGSALLSGRDYQCGDVISISVTPQATTTDQNTVPFRIFVEVIPGA